MAKDNANEQEATTSFGEGFFGRRPQQASATEGKTTSNRQEQTSFLDGLRLEMQVIRVALASTVLGQDSALEGISKAMLGNRLLQDPKGHAGPRAVMLFVGPAGSGKGLAAATLCKALVGYQLHTIDLSQLTQESQTAALIGNEPSYRDSEPGIMNVQVRKHPKTVVLFENCDKCHPAHIQTLTDLLSTGELSDLCGLDENGNKDIHNRTPVDYRQAVLVFSTTAPYDVYSAPTFEAVLKAQPTHAESMLLDALLKVPATGEDSTSSRRQFSPAIVDQWRGGRTVYFKELNLDTLLQVATRATIAHESLLRARLGFSSTGHTHAILLQAMLLSLAPKVGANEAQTSVPHKLYGPLMDHILGQANVPTEVKFDISPKALTHWDNARARLVGGSADTDLLQQCRRRGLKLELDWTISTAFDQFTLNGITLAQVKAGEDISGPGAIRVEVPQVAFADIAGHVYIKKRLGEVVQMLRTCHDPAVRKIIPKGMMLYGPPGTGKTMLAKALAHEVDLPFLNTTGTELLTPSFTQEIFRRARKYAPCVVFVDEIDALGSREPNKVGSTIAINQLLAEMDGFDSASSGMVFVIAATNWPDNVDPALRRAGRLDLHLEVPQLDPPARGFFIDRVMQLPVAPDVNRDKLIRLTSGMSGAELEQLHRELQLALRREQQTVLSANIVLETINTLRYGERSRRPLPEDHLINTAIHEAGHAVISRVVNPETRISHITIVSRGNYAGYVAYDRDSLAHRRFTLSEVNDELAVLLAGRCAQEKLQPGSADDGASSDLAHATRIAMAAVGQWGLQAEYGLLALAQDTAPALQQAAAPHLIKACNQLLQGAQDRCNALLESHWPRVCALQQRLLQEEVVLGEDW